METNTFNRIEADTKTLLSCASIARDAAYRRAFAAEELATIYRNALRHIAACDEKDPARYVQKVDEIACAVLAANEDAHVWEMPPPHSNAQSNAL